jgi:hypothetical protein
MNLTSVSFIARERNGSVAGLIEPRRGGPLPAKGNCVSSFLEGGNPMKKWISLFSLTCLTLTSFGLAFSQGVVTGLIIDAQDLQFIPSATPKVIDEDGREIYGSAYVEKEWFEKQGIVSYAESLPEAKTNSRVSGNPFVVKAIRVAGPNSRDLILSNEDARKIRELSKNLNFLDHAKVVIIVP